MSDEHEHDDAAPLVVVGMIALPAFDVAARKQVAYVECLQAQEALYWEARRRGWQLDDKAVGDILRLVAPILREHELQR